MKEDTASPLVKDQALVNGEPQRHSSHAPTSVVIDVTNTTNGTAMRQTNSAQDVVQLMHEFNRYIEDGSKEMFGNLTEVMEEKLVRLPDDAAKEVSTYFSDMTATVQKTQQQELQRQLQEIEARLVRPLEELAFSDAALYKETTPKKRKKTNATSAEEIERNKLIIVGANSTLQESSRRMRTREIIRNLNVAPFYYSVTLLNRWFRKLSYPPVFIINSFRGMASLIKSPSPMGSKKKDQSYEESVQNAELMQAGWKRTGEIAAKGPLARKWAIMRRSAEIWAYFSSFYIKERRMLNKYNSGRWSAEKFSEERRKLGAEVTQNLLKLGPTFIKVHFNE